VDGGILPDEPPVVISPDDVDPGEQSSGTFDWTSEVIAFTNPRVKHRAYDLTYRQFRDNKVQTDTERTDRLSMRVDNEMIDALKIFRNNYSENGIYPIAAWLLEIGWIHMIYDYSDELLKLSEIMMHMWSNNNTDTQNEVLRRVDDIRLTIDNSSLRKQMTPTVPAWLAAAVRQLSIDLHMDISDVCRLCIGIGMRTDFEEHTLPRVYTRKIDAIEDTFSRKLEVMIQDLEYYRSKF
jgi:hypothetical protein